MPSKTVGINVDRKQHLPGRGPACHPRFHCRGSSHPSSQPQGPVDPLSPDPQPSRLRLQGAPATAALQGQPWAAGGAPGPAGPVGTLGSWAAAAHPCCGGWLPASLPWVLGPCPGVLPTISSFSVATPTGQPALCTCTLAHWGPDRPLPPGGRGSLVGVARRQAAAASAGWCLPASSWPTCLEGRPVPGEAWAPARLARGGVPGMGSKAAGLRP